MPGEPREFVQTWQSTVCVLGKTEIGEGLCTCEGCSVPPRDCLLGWMHSAHCFSILRDMSSHLSGGQPLGSTAHRHSLSPQPPSSNLPLLQSRSVGPEMPTFSLLSLEGISTLPGAENKNTAPPPPDETNFYFLS